ncbi:hypothetical protein Tco_0179719 [Tanacetum coccineum]
MNLRRSGVGADELSPTLYLGPRTIPNLFRGCNVTSGLSTLRSVESRCKGGDEVGSSMGKSCGVPGGGVPDGGVSTLVMVEVIQVVVVRESEVVVMTIGKVVMVETSAVSNGQSLSADGPVQTVGKAATIESGRSCAAPPPIPSILTSLSCHSSEDYSYHAITSSVAGISAGSSSGTPHPPPSESSSG